MPPINWDISEDSPQNPSIGIRKLTLLASVKKRIRQKSANAMRSSMIPPQKKFDFRNSITFFTLLSISLPLPSSLKSYVRNAPKAIRRV